MPTAMPTTTKRISFTMAWSPTHSKIRRSLHLHLRGLRDFGPFGDLRFLKFRELLRWPGSRVDAEINQARPHVGLLDDARKLGIEPLHDRLRRACRGEHGLP